MVVVLPFDAHNHVHMGPTSSLEQLLKLSSPRPCCISGMAVMSTHPNDFSKVLELAGAFSNSNENNEDEDDARSTTTTSMKIVPCIGIHPWFLHELSKEDWEHVVVVDDQQEQDQQQQDQQRHRQRHRRPKWVHEMEMLLQQHPHVAVGEIGLDKYHFDYHTKELTTSIDIQIEAMEYQMELASIYQRPVSIHCVRALGPIMDIILFKKNNNRRIHHNRQLPPALYFHAWGGKVGSATQLIRSIENPKQGPQPNTKCYFGFAPIVNFQFQKSSLSKKTIEVIQEVGITRLVLETDHEDGNQIESSMALSIVHISKALNVTPEELIRITNENVCHLYNITL